MTATDVRRDFAFSGLVACHACGCALVGEIRKQHYVYHCCTGYADKFRGKPASCRRKNIRKEAFEAPFTKMLGRLQFDGEVLEWVCEALHASHALEGCEHEPAIERYQAEKKILEESRFSNSRGTPKGFREAGTPRKAPLAELPIIESRSGRGGK